MPYNTTAIPPRTEATGHTQLPLSRVKKIIAADPDVNVCSNNAAFIITLAAEMFVQHLTTQAANIAKAERKPRRNIQYKDMANAVSHNDNLEFLEDVVPRTVSYKKVKDTAIATQAKLRNEPGASIVVTSAAASNKGSRNGPEKKDWPKAKANGFTPRIIGGADREDRMSPDGSTDATAQLKEEIEAVNERDGDSRDRDGDIEMAG